PFVLTGIPGREHLLAILTEEPLDLGWMPPNRQIPARILDRADIEQLISLIQSLEPGSWTALATYCDVTVRANVVRKKAGEPNPRQARLCGFWRRARTSKRSPFGPTAQSWRRATGTATPPSGTWRAERPGEPSRGIRAMCGPSRLAPTASRSFPSVAA